MIDAIASLRSEARQPTAGATWRWLKVWFRTVVVPAGLRAAATWLGCAVVAAVVFGPTAMHPSDVTGLALRDLGTGLVLGMTWLLMFVPTARTIVRPADGYLRSLPGDPGAARLVGGLALIVLQLPWLVLWIAGEGLLGAAIVLATTIAAVALASWRPPTRRPSFPVWRQPGAALRAIHLRALRRRAGDTLMRGAGIAVLAGIAAGLLVRNNQLAGEVAGVVGTSIIAVMLVPGQAGPALITVVTHRETAWMAEASGVSWTTRIAALVYSIVAVHFVATAIAVAVAMVIAGANPWLPVLAFGTMFGTALGEARAMLVHEASPMVAARVVIGAIITAAVAVVCLATLGASGVIAVIVIGATALLLVKP